MMNPYDFFNQIQQQNRIHISDPKKPGEIMAYYHDEDTLKDFINDLYHKLDLEICPTHLTTKIKNNGYIENWRPKWLTFTDEEGYEVPPCINNQPCCCVNINK